MATRTGFKPRVYRAGRPPDFDDLAADEPLEPRELRFVDEYLLDLNGAAAAVRAGYAPKSAAVRACRLMQRPRVQTALAAAYAERQARTGVTADRVLRDIDAAATLDVGDLFTTDGNDLLVRNVRALPAYVRRCITSIEVVKRNLNAGDGHIDTLYKVKLIDKAKMLELLAKHTGLTREDTQAPAANVPAFALPPETRGVSVH